MWGSEVDHMVLHIKRTPSKKVQLIITLFAAFALVAQPLYGLATIRVAHAASENITQLAFTNSPQNVPADIEASLGVQLRNAGGASEQTDNTGVRLVLTTSSPTGEFAEGAVSTDWKSTFDDAFNKDTANKSFRYKDATPGTYTITAKVSGGGIAEEVSAVQQITITAATQPAPAAEVDSTPPAVNFITPENNPQSDSKIHVTVSDDNLQKVSFTMTRLSDGAQVNTSPVLPEAGQATLDLNEYDLCANDRLHACNSDWLTHGSYQIRAAAYDKFGNRNITTFRTIVVDKMAPDGSFEVPGTTSGIMSFQVHISDADAGLASQQVVLRDGSGDVVENWEYNVSTGAVRVIEGNGTFDYQGDQHSGVLTITFDSTGLNGVYDLRLFTKDQLGNGRSDIYGQLSVDNEAPSSTIVLTSPKNPMASTVPISIAGVVTGDFSSLKLLRDDDPTTAFDLTAEAKDNGGNWTYTIPADQVVQGTYNFSVVASDQYGNETTAALDPIVVSAFIPGLGSSSPLGLSSPLADAFIVPRAFTRSGLTTPFTAAQTPAASETAVLGAQSTNDPTQSSDLPAVAATTDGWKFFGIAWYWWTLLAMGVGGMSWWTVASLRRKGELA